MELGLELWWSGCRALSLTPVVPSPRGPWGLAHSGDSTVLELQSEMAKQTQSRDLSDVHRVGRQSAAHPHLFSSPLQLPTDHKNTFLFLFQMWPQNCSQRKPLSSQYKLTGAGSESLAPTLFVERLRGARHCHRAARTQPFTTKTRGPCPQGKRWGKDQQNLSVKRPTVVRTIEPEKSQCWCWRERRGPTSNGCSRKACAKRQTEKNGANAHYWDQETWNNS